MTNSKTATAFLLAFVCGGSWAAGQSPGVFTPVGNMTAPRAGHTATLLRDGKVLITGGSQELVSTSSAEIYDPSTRTFRLTGSMSVPRTFHAAVMLPDGTVLVAGGDANGTAELYDPPTGLFRPVGSTSDLIGPQFAALLNDGRVLITSAAAPGYIPAVTSGQSATLFDPSNAAFRSLGPWPLQVSSLTMLKDGKVLLQGSDPDGLIRAALYDPEKSVFTLEGPPAQPWTIVTATLVASGKVVDTTISTEEAWPTGVAELYDPSSEAFSSIKMADLRRWPSATLLPDGTLLISGGGNSDTSWWTFATNGAEIYDPAAHTFSVTGSMAANRERHTSTVLGDGTVLVAGGGENGYGTATAEIYRPAAPTPGPVLASLSSSGIGQGAIWHVVGDIASSSSPAAIGEALSMYTTGLIPGGVIPPQVAVGGRLAEVLFFGDAPGYPGYYQVNFLVPGDVASGPSVTVRLSYLGRSSNEVTIAIR
jgi:hypothetical protein